MSKVAVTGASGFVGRALMARLASGPHEAIALVRTGATTGQRLLPDLASLAAGAAHVDLAEIEVLVHCAAITQSRKGMTETERRHLVAVNAGATVALARQALAAGVRRFVLVSSAKVNGETTPPGRPFCANDVPAPQDHYAETKLQAEQGLLAVASGTEIQTVIIRPPLVYGPGVGGNFRQLVKLAARGLPIPFGGVSNRRSMIAVDNLADLIATAIDHPAAAGRILMACDGEDLSTPDLIARLACLQAAPVRLPYVPPVVLTSLLALLGRRSIAERLLGSLQVEGESARQLLGWTPPLTVDAALQKTVASLR